MVAVARRYPASMRAARASSGSQRGMSLLEIMLVMALLGLAMALAGVSFGAFEGPKLKQAAVSISAATRAAYTHANTSGLPTRLRFDFNEAKFYLEEASAPVFAVKKAPPPQQAAREAEAAALAAGKGASSGVRPSPPMFTPIAAKGMELEEGEKGRRLPGGVRFASVDTEHLEEPVVEGTAELYFWPGGMTESAVIQVAIGDRSEPTVLSIEVAPLTGRTRIVKGATLLKRVDRGEDIVGDREDDEQ